MQIQIQNIQNYCFDCWLCWHCWCCFCANALNAWRAKRNESKWKKKTTTATTAKKMFLTKIYAPKQKLYGRQTRKTPIRTHENSHYINKTHTHTHNYRIRSPTFTYTSLLLFLCSFLSHSRSEILCAFSLALCLSVSLCDAKCTTMPFSRILKSLLPIRCLPS